MHRPRGSHAKQYGWGRGNRTGRRKPHPDLRHAAQVPDALGPQFGDILLFQLDRKPFSRDASISDCTFVASYNLTNDADNKIIVPGEPPVWSPALHSIKLKSDTGVYYRDPSAAHFPEHTSDPLVSSILHIQPSFEMNDIDIASCSHILDKLWRFAQGSLNPESDSFSFLAQVIGTTVLFSRRETSAKAVISDMTGCGHNFVAANTTWSEGYKHSTNSQRIISYKVGGLKLLVRFKVDCHLRHDHAKDSSSISSAEGATGTGWKAEEASPVIIQSRGTLINQSDIVDIKTRSGYKDRSDIMKTQLPRHWVRQITQSVLTFHTSGYFSDLTCTSISNELRKWEAKNKSNIARYAAVLDAIKQAAVKHKDGQIEIRCSGPSSLEMHALAEEELGKWDAVSGCLLKKLAAK